MMKAQSQVAVVEKKKTLKRLEPNYKRQEFRKTESIHDHDKHIRLHEECKDITCLNLSIWDQANSGGLRRALDFFPTRDQLGVWTHQRLQAYSIRSVLHNTD